MAAVSLSEAAVRRNWHKNGPKSHLAAVRLVAEARPARTMTYDYKRTGTPTLLAASTLWM